jgi:hypothetical protein
MDTLSTRCVNLRDNIKVQFEVQWTGGCRLALNDAIRKLRSRMRSTAAVTVATIVGPRLSICSKEEMRIA